MMRLHSWLAVVCLCWAAAAAGACDVVYDSHNKALLLGGVIPGCKEAKDGCSSHRTDLSDGYWLQFCKFQEGLSWGACSTKQAAKSLEYAKTLGGGRALQLSPCDLYQYLRGRTLWLLGDSHTKSFYRALQCFLIDFWENQAECETSTDAEAVQQLKNLPAASGDSQCIHLRGPAGGRICIVHVVLGTSLVNNKNVADGGVLPLLHSKFARPEDIFYINFSTWHKKSPAWWADYRPALHALGQYYQSTKEKWPHLLFRETPAKHTQLKTKCQAAAGYTYDRSTGLLELASAARSDGYLMWSLGAVENSIMHDILGKYDISVVPAFNITVELADNHVTSTKELDCLHYCHPGVPEMWVWSLYDALRHGQGKVKPLHIDNDNKAQQEAGSASHQPNHCVKSYTAKFRM